jgi:hypothetical protein
MSRYLTEDILESVKRSGFVPISETTWSDADLTALATEELQNKIVPTIMTVREEYFLTHKQQTITATLDRYTMPERSIGQAMKDVLFMPNTSSPRDIYPVAKVSVHELRAWDGATGTPGIFYIEGDEIVFVPPPSATNAAALFYYYRRPSKLVATTSCTKITAITQGATNTTFTVNTDLTASLSAGDLVDFASMKSPFLSWADDVAIVSISATEVVVLNSSVVNVVNAVEPQVGDYICPAGSANVPQVPVEFHTILAEMVNARIMKALGNMESYAAIQANVQEMLANTLHLMSNRIEAAVDLIFDRNSILNNVSSSSYRFTVR